MNVESLPQATPSPQNVPGRHGVAGTQATGSLPQVVRGVVFDLDGTLVNTAADIARAVNAMLFERGEEPRSVEYVEQFLGEGTRELIAGVYRGMGIEPSPERLNIDTARYVEHYASVPVLDSTIYHDALPTLAALRAAGVQVGVCTNKGQEMAEAVLRHLGLYEHVDVVVGGDALPVRKPHPGHLLATVRQMAIDSHGALFVGDTDIDVECARRAGIPCLIVDWAPTSCVGSSAPGRLHQFADLLELVAPSATQQPGLGGANGTPSPPQPGRTPSGARQHHRAKERRSVEPRSSQDRAKIAAGRQAVKTYCRDGMKLGLGSGTTSHWFVRVLAEHVKEGLDVIGVPTSTATRDLALELGIKLADINELGELDVTIDGPDEIDRQGSMIKGGGACLLWEKIAARAARKMVVVADATKVVNQLGAFPLPIEVIPFGRVATERLILELLAEGGYPQEVRITPRLRGRDILVTDSGNYILDVHLHAVTDPAWLTVHLNEIPGVVENGLFVGIGKEMVLGHPDSTADVIVLPMDDAQGGPGNTADDHTQTGTQA